MKTQRGSSLIGIIVALVLLLFVGLYFLTYKPGSGVAGEKAGYGVRKDKVGETIVGQSIARAKDAKCMEDIKQVRAAIEIANPAGETPPAALTELKLPKEMIECPIGHEPYEYDPATGKVRCPHPGHEKY